jgi:hypothetical protein
MAMLRAMGIPLEGIVRRVLWGGPGRKARHAIARVSPDPYPPVVVHEVFAFALP